MDSAVFPNTSALEAIRVLLGSAGLAIAVWGFMHAADGRMVLPRPVRDEFIRSRRERMGAFAALNLILGFQAVIVANTPDAAVPSLAGATGNVAQILVLGLMIGVMLRQIDLWSRHEGIAVDQPLRPDDGERLTEAARIGRPMIHEINNHLGVAIGALDLASMEPGLPEEQRRELEDAAEHLHSAAGQLRHLQRLVRGLGGPLDRPVLPDLSDPPPPPEGG